jgi:hypothetical protein
MSDTSRYTLTYLSCSYVITPPNNLCIWNRIMNEVVIRELQYLTIITECVEEIIN